MASAGNSTRIGLGFDVHPLVRRREMRFLGILVSSEFGPEGHSDGDALSHSVADALLGAAGLGDIGTYFPADMPAFKDISGEDLLRRTVTLLKENGWKPLQVDTVIWLEHPTLAPHLPQLRTCLARVLDIAESCVSVKVKHGEGLGFVGRGEGIAVWAVALVVAADDEKPSRKKEETTLVRTAQSPSPETISPQEIPDAVIYIDGGADPNPGAAAAGIAVQFADGRTQKAGKFLGEHLTNNQAEYMALLWALAEAKRLNIQNLEIRSDSELLVNQITGTYKVRKPQLLELHRQAREEIGRFRNFTITQVQREENKDANREVAKILYSLKKQGPDNPSAGSPRKIMLF